MNSKYFTNVSIKHQELNIAYIVQNLVRLNDTFITSIDIEPDRRRRPKKFNNIVCPGEMRYRISAEAYISAKDSLLEIRDSLGKESHLQNQHFYVNGEIDEERYLVRYDHVYNHPNKPMIERTFISIQRKVERKWIYKNTDRGIQAVTCQLNFG